MQCQVVISIVLTARRRKLLGYERGARCVVGSGGSIVRKVRIAKFRVTVHHVQFFPNDCQLVGVPEICHEQVELLLVFGHGAVVIVAENHTEFIVREGFVQAFQTNNSQLVTA